MIRAMAKLSEDIELIKASGLFDSIWYTTEYPDVKHLGQDPIEHYLRFGAQLHRNPSPKFDTHYYLTSNPDVAAAGLNPLTHYMTFGAKEGRAPLPFARSPQQYSQSIDIVVPVFNALDDVKKCMESIRNRNDGFTVRTIIVNDGSDQATTAWLREYCHAHKTFELIEHFSNQGYTKAINTGLRTTAAPYVVLLNSDTIATRGWLKGLVRCINSGPKIGIVGPLSNAASWQNVPDLYDVTGAFAVNELPSFMSPDDMAGMVAMVSKRTYPATPFVNGFCFMIKRQVIDAIGFMDDENFPIGYGEENDYCIRAGDAGFMLAIADDTYVFHAKSRSFGHERRKALSQQGGETLNRKHTVVKCNALVRQVKSTDQLDHVRASVKAALIKHDSFIDTSEIMSLRILFLLPVSGGSGGTHSVVQEVSEMRRLGISANVAVHREHVAQFLDLYSDVPYVSTLFVGFDADNILGVAEDYDVVIATIFRSMELVKQIVEVNRHILPAYYVQDYEPLFFSPDTVNWKAACDSYGLVPQTTLFAKTRWIADKVQAEHGVPVHKVEPSIDHDVYKPSIKSQDGRLHVAAMIRPQTPYRGAERTMRVLSRISKAHFDRLSIHLFGCAEDTAHFQSLQRDFKYENHGVLKRREVAGLLARSDIFIDLSDYQAFGRTALEAMACGCAVMVPIHGGTDEYAIDGVNALVVDSFDEDQSFSRLDALVQSITQLRTMQHKGLLTASRYTAHAAAVSELSVLAKSLARHRVIYPAIPKRILVLVPSLRKDQQPTGSAHVRLLLPYRSAAVRKNWSIKINRPDELPEPGTADVVVLQRDAGGSTLSSLEAWLPRWRASGGTFIWEVDDDLLDGEGLRKRGAFLDAIEGLAKKVRWLSMHADIVTVSTSTLADKIRPFNKNVHIVPNYLDANLWQLKHLRDHTKGSYAKVKGGPVRIGYIGTPSHQEDVEIVKEAMQRIQFEYGDGVEIEVIGVFQNITPLFGKRVGLPKKNDYPNFVKWLHQRVHWDIGIIPLEDDDFNKSKSHLKFLEYAALDMAIVCSDVESYRHIAQHERNALVVEKSSTAWYEAIKDLVEHVEKRERFAHQAYSDLVTSYTIEVNAGAYLSVLDQTGCPAPTERID